MKRYERKLKQIGLKRQTHQLRIHPSEIEAKEQKERAEREKPASSAS